MSNVTNKITSVYFDTQKKNIDNPSQKSPKNLDDKPHKINLNFENSKNIINVNNNLANNSFTSDNDSKIDKEQKEYDRQNSRSTNYSFLLKIYRNILEFCISKMQEQFCLPTKSLSFYRLYILLLNIQILKYLFRQKH